MANQIKDFITNNIIPNKNSESTSEIIKYIFSTISLIAVALYIINLYYSTSRHQENGNFIMYLITVLIAYLAYKFIKSGISGEKIVFSPVGLAGYTIINVLICAAFLFINTGGANGSVVLSLKILGFLFFPTLIVLINYSFSQMILNNIVSYKNEEQPFKILMTLGFSFVIFLTFLVVISFFGMYNLYVIFAILIGILAVSYKEFMLVCTSLFTYKIEFDNHKLNSTTGDLINLKLLSAEFSFIILTFLIGVNFVNIVRPMPIGWDDLGVYMNYPQIMASSGEVLKGAGMIAWQLFTGIGFMFHSAPQAFFMNQVGGILSIIVLIIVFADLFKTETKKHLSVPIILATMFYSMPMVIFQQAKDMKLDPGLFFISVIGIYLLFKLMLRYLGHENNIIENTSSDNDLVDTYIQKSSNKAMDLIKSIFSSVYKSSKGEKDLFNRKDILIYLVVIGSVVGLAFTIKFTTLMLILGLIGVIFYTKLGLSGFLGFFSFFIAIFTKLKLWEMMNVNFPKDDTVWINGTFYMFMTIGIVLFSYSFLKYKQDSFIKALLITFIFGFGISLPILPWITKNIIELKGENVSVGALLSGRGGNFEVDYSKIYSKSELDTIEKKFKVEATSASGKTQNEDLGRYFGYEDGVNNYLKLPWNLTMQSNQGGEYTEITFFFLVFLPIILLFLPYRNIFLPVGVFVFSLSMYFYFIDTNTSKILTEYFSSKILPNGYIYVLGAFLIPLIYFLYSLRVDKLTQVFKLNFIFFATYTFLFVIAAYGIVWYGIPMYFSMLLMIGVGFSYVSGRSENETYDMFKIFGSFMAMLLVSIYFFKSTLPHGMDNIVNAGFTEFKAGTLTQDEAIFVSHPDYFTILANLNINDGQKLSSQVINEIGDSNLKKLLVAYIGEKPELNKLEGILKETIRTDLSKMIKDELIVQSMKVEAKRVLLSLYNKVLYPTVEFQNKDKIYRIGTFLTYFIHDNRSRYYDDSLVQNFQKYFYNEDPDKTIERMKKIGIKYFLTDLNAATIDKDPRHDLTTRYENLLRTFKSDKLELIQTDSLCLQLALEEKAPNYLSIAGVNYESYGTGGTVISRGQKQIECYNHMLDLMKNGKVNEKSYSYLLPIAKYIQENKLNDQSKILQAFQQYAGHGWLALFRIK